MRYLAIALAAILSAEPLAAAEGEIIKTDWNGFRREVAARKLRGRAVRIGLAAGGEVKTNLLELTDTGLEARVTRATKQWATAGGNAQIPREQIVSVRFGGRTGHGGRTGALIGIAAGAGTAAAIATSVDCFEGGCLIALPVAGVALAAIGGVAGYFIGRSTGKPGPEFSLAP